MGLPKQGETLGICRWKLRFSNKLRYDSLRESLKRRADACLNFEKT